MNPAFALAKVLKLSVRFWSSNSEPAIAAMETNNAIPAITINISKSPYLLNSVFVSADIQFIVTSLGLVCVFGHTSIAVAEYASAYAFWFAPRWLLIHPLSRYPPKIYIGVAFAPLGL